MNINKDRAEQIAAVIENGNAVERSHWAWRVVGELLADWEELTHENQRLRAKDESAERFCKEMLCRCADAIHAETSLPKTADGVTILPGMKLYPLHPLEDGDEDDEGDFAVVEMYAKNGFSGEDNVDPEDLPKNYSSSEAASKAREKLSAVKP